MSAISLKSISGITSITTPAGVDNQFTLHNNNTTEAVKLDTAGNFHFHNHLNITGVSTASNFKTGTSNLHNTGLNVQDLDVDGHTNLDNVSVAGVSTFTGNVIVDSGTVRCNNGFSSDVDLYLNADANNNGSGSIIFQESGSERVRITSAGSVGINTTSPNRRFTLYQDATTRMNLKSLANSTVGIEFGDPDDENIGYIVYDNTDNSMAFGANAGQRLRITSNGNVGIGIVDPDQQLEVSGIIKVGSYFQGGASGTATNNWHFGAEGNGEFRFYTGNYGAGNLKQTINNNGDVLPGVHNTSDLGSSSKRWRNVYTTDLQLSNEGKTNDVDGTWGNYTIQEGESELFLINNRNGKKYVFLLKEVL